MSTILLTFGLFLLIILGMSVGYIFSKRSIKGSCGGITALGMKNVRLRNAVRYVAAKTGSRGIGKNYRRPINQPPDCFPAVSYRFT